LISALLETKNEYVQWMLKDAIKHNQYVRNRLADLLEVSADYYRQPYRESLQIESIKTDIVKSIMRDIDFYEDGNLVSYRTVLRKDGIITNLVKVEGTSDDVQTRRLIQEVNELYEEIRKLVPNL
jgi:K+ transporter